MRKKFLKLWLSRTAQATKAELSKKGMMVEILKIFAIKVKIISMLTVMVMSIISYFISEIIFLAIFLLPLDFILQPFGWSEYLFLYACVALLVAVVIWSRKSLISSNILEAHLFALRSLFSLLRKSTAAELKQGVELYAERMRQFLQQGL